MKMLQRLSVGNLTRKDVLPLFKQTFPDRRQYILSTQTSVADIVMQYKGLSLPYAVSCEALLYIIAYCYLSYVQLEQEVDCILKKRDVVKSASEDWKGKWAQAIISYALTLKSKPVKSALKVVETKFAGMPVLMTLGAVLS